MLTSEGAIVGKRNQNINWKERTWQKLELDVKSTGGISNFYLYFSKFGVNDFQHLKVM